LSGRDFQNELREAIESLAGADLPSAAEDLRPISLLKRLGITIPPSLDDPDEGSEEDRLTLIAPVSGYEPTVDLDSAALDLDEWDDPARSGYAPTLDVPDIEDSQPALERTAKERSMARQRLGRHEVLATLGRGGMGIVAEGYDRDLGRRVALKVVRDPEGLDESRLARFVAEAQLTAQLEHPNIVPVHEFGISLEGELYYSMKKVEGVALADALMLVEAGEASAKERWTLRRLLGVVVQICNAMAYAHRRGVIHRDLKPDNVMLGEFGEVLVLDWGLARLVHRDEVDAARGEARDEVRTARDGISLTRDGTTIGTPGFMSPEQADGRLSELSPASDVWSLGAILYTILTGTLPHTGKNLVTLIHQTIGHAVQDCRERAPDRRIPEELANICRRALELAPADRYADAGALRAAIELFLEGARRRAEALERLAQGRALQDRHDALGDEIAEAKRRLDALEAAVDPWTPIADKQELLDARDAVAALLVERATCFAHLVIAGERALAHDPGNADARAFLAGAWWTRFEDAEDRRDEADQAWYASRVREYDDGPYSRLLEGTGSVALDTDPTGALVLCQRYERHGLIWSLGEPTELGRTPLDVPLAMGSYLLTLKADGRADTRYPVLISRGRRWEASAPVPMLTPEQIGDGWVYVPAGPCVLGDDGLAVDALKPGERDVEGFLIGEFPVTVAEYLEFLTDIAREDADAAHDRVPRREPDTTGNAVGYWPRPEPGEPYRVPEEDSDGDEWPPTLPMLAISYHDAVAYAEWLGRKAGWPCCVPPEVWWEKAARGVDGRAYPWGEVPDAALAKLKDSREGGNLQPEPVGVFETDRSPYGVRDVSGGMSEWCTPANPDSELCAVRGGSWASTLRQGRLANRFELRPDRVQTYLGFRIARSLR